MKKSLIFIVCLFLCFLQAEAQKIKFKPVTKQEMEMKQCSFYPEAKAVILEKRGEIILGMDDGGLNYTYIEGQRIKVLEEEEKSRGDIKIRIYSPQNSDSREKIIEIRGVTYNLENGKVVETKLEKKDIYRNRLNEYVEEISFALPAVKVGSVLEYFYAKTSYFVTTLESWFFQEDIPTLLNDFTYVTADYFNFQARMSGNVQTVERKEKASNVLLFDETHPGKSVRLVGKDIPPVEMEPFVSNLVDLPFRIDFQMVSVDLPGVPIQKIAGTYADFNKSFLERETFWRTATRGSVPKELKEALVGKEGKEKALYIYQWLQKRVKWDKTNGLLSSRSIADLIKGGSGDAADINLNLNSLFVQSGLDAYPVVLSTRGHGMIHPVYPNFNDFNYVISVVNTPDGPLLCDATSKGPAGLLPPRCLNGSGWYVAKEGGGHLPLKQSGSDIKFVTTDISFSEDKMKVDIAESNREYAALEWLESREEHASDEVPQELQERFEEWEIGNYRVEETEKDVKQYFTMEKAMDGAEVFYIHPFPYGILSESPFKRDKRMAVVDFPYGLQYTFSTVIRVPEGFEAELPEPVEMLLSKRGALLALAVLQNGNDITLTVRVVMKQLLYAPDEYPELKLLFEKIAELSKMVVVLKKKA